MSSDNVTELLMQLGMRLDQQERQIKEQQQRIEDLTSENEQLKTLLKQQGDKKGSKPPKFKEDYSVENHTNQKKSKRGQQSTGRRPQASKLRLVDRFVDVYADGIAKSLCVERRCQYVWRIIDGKARYIGYRLFAPPTSQTLPQIEGVRNSWSEYGLEISLIVGYLHYWVGISLDHACGVMQFFTGLALTKSQANALLEQLSWDWQEQYDTIAELLAYQLVVYVDETGWQVGSHSCYTWAFSTTMHVLFRCGVSRGKAEAQAILGEQFAGIGVTDDYGAYQSLFNEHQLCWAHLLRKAIKLMLQHPEVPQYQTFLDTLYRIYQQAVRWQKDQRLSVGRADKVTILKNRILKLCSGSGTAIDKHTMPTHQQTFIRLQNELVKGLDALFVFVTHPHVEPTNNRSERNVRREAEVRKGGRTSKTDRGAKRRGIIMTVFATLNTRFDAFTLETLLAEINRWVDTGISLFQAELDELKQAHAPPAA
ncbi:MAG: transposase [Cyanobacteria bacterium J06633_2]